jgi:hypothetical protein
MEDLCQGIFFMPSVVAPENDQLEFSAAPSLADEIDKGDVLESLPETLNPFRDDSCFKVSICNSR